jgi:phosphoribosylformylglycinamidine synthase
VKVKVYITPKAGVLDPQGQAVQGALLSLGYGEVGDVRVGKYITLEVEDGIEDIAGRVDEMCAKLLANPIIEDYRYELEQA